MKTQRKIKAHSTFWRVCRWDKPWANRHVGGVAPAVTEITTTANPHNIRAKKDRCNTIYPEKTVKFVASNRFGARGTSLVTKHASFFVLKYEQFLIGNHCIFYLFVHVCKRA